jgi:hypothetical protein
MFEKIPKEVRKLGKKEAVVEESEYDIPTELYPGPTSQVRRIADDQVEEGGEDVYESRKLLIRQMHGLIAKEVHGGSSEYDSWSDLEDSFAFAYEPIPLNISMDTWRKMSREDILKTVRSKKMQQEFELMSRSEILGKIEMMLKSARYLSDKFGVNHVPHRLSASDGDLAQKFVRPSMKKTRAQVHHNHPVATDVNGNNHQTFGTDGSIISSFSVGMPGYISRTEISKFCDGDHQPSLLPPAQNHCQKAAISRRHLVSPEFVPPPPPVIQKQVARVKEYLPRVTHLHDSWSSRASSILKNPESIYVSRHELIQQINGAPTEDLQTRRNSKPRIHDSWSSRSSSILAKSYEEPSSMLRTEMLEKIQMFNFDGKSRKQGDCGQTLPLSTEQEKDNNGKGSTASTIKQAVQAEMQDSKILQEKHDSRHDDIGLQGETEAEPEILSSFDMSDVCSCESCNSYSDCSCCDHSKSDTSLETIINGNLSSEEENKG